MLENPRRSKRELIQLNPSLNGVTADYLNEYAHITVAHMLGGFPKVLQNLREYPIKLYEERYSPTFYLNPVNEKNFPIVEKINGCARRVNSGIADGTLTEDELREITAELGELFYGKRAPMF